MINYSNYIDIFRQEFGLSRYNFSLSVSSCIATENTTHYILTSSNGTCGTVAKSLAGDRSSVVYHNAVSMTLTSYYYGLRAAFAVCSILNPAIRPKQFGPHAKSEFAHFLTLYLIYPKNIVLDLFPLQI